MNIVDIATIAQLPALGLVLYLLYQERKERLETQAKLIEVLQKVANIEALAEAA